MKYIADLMRGAAYGCVVAITFLFVFAPTTFGTLLGKVDQGRWGQFECYDCDYEYEGINL